MLRLRTPRISLGTGHLRLRVPRGYPVLGQARLEQLILPVFTVAVDLVEGETLVREVGDATINTLESINLPPLSLPIVKSGRAVVDGGLINNVPADVLVTKKCNFVIASTVTAKLEKDFIGIRSKGCSRRGSTLQVIMRQRMIQDYGMNAVGVQPADCVIAPDLTSFDISEFTRADEMALVGETTTNATMVSLRKMLSKLDPKLFESPSSSSIPSSDKVTNDERAEEMAREKFRARGA